MNADYGIDAPDVIRNLAIGGAVGLSLGISGVAGWLPPVLTAHVGSLVFHLPVMSMGFGAAVGLFIAAAWMYVGSRYGKISAREKLLNHIS